MGIGLTTVTQRDSSSPRSSHAARKLAVRDFSGRCTHSLEVRSTGRSKIHDEMCNVASRYRIPQDASQIFKGPCSRVCLEILSNPKCGCHPCLKRSLQYQWHSRNWLPQLQNPSARVIASGRTLRCLLHCQPLHQID